MITTRDLLLSLICEGSEQRFMGHNILRPLEQVSVTLEKHATSFYELTWRDAPTATVAVTILS